MGNQEYDQFVKALERQKKEVAKSSENERKEFLKSVGVFTKNGNLTKSFKQICIPKDRD
jgi:hypothetical protein